MRKPDPLEYGLTEASAARLRDDLEQRHRRLKSISGHGLFPLSVLAGIGLAQLTEHWFLGFVAVFVGLVWAEPRVIDRLSKGPERYEAFREATTLYESWRRRTSEEFWLGLDGCGFEREVAALLRRRGHLVKERGGKGDRGIDLEVDGDTVVQCKAHRKPVAPAVVRELYGAMQLDGRESALLISTQGFTPGAWKLGNEIGIALWDVSVLVEMQLEESPHVKQGNGETSATLITGKR